VRAITIIIVLSVLGVTLNASAQSDPRALELRERLSKNVADLVIEDITPTPVPGLFEVIHSRGVLYVSEDGRYALSGRLLDLDLRENLTERASSKRRLRELSEVPENQLIVFPATDATKHVLTTFTDIDCPYCRKMHLEMDQMNALGITVRYLLYPRAGMQSESYTKAVSVWCAGDQLSAMTTAKSGRTPKKAECDNPIVQHMALANRLGLTGTPFTITDTGRVISGYMPAARLIESLDADK
jgi:thiol:disulfide interchange protein DsbC